jgi:hypothetical protein
MQQVGLVSVSSSWGMFSTGSQYENEMESAEQRPTENPESGEPAIEFHQGVIPEAEMQESVDDRKGVEPDLERWRVDERQYDNEQGSVQSSKRRIRSLVTDRERCEKEPPLQTRPPCTYGNAAGRPHHR